MNISSLALTKEASHQLHKRSGEVADEIQSLAPVFWFSNWFFLTTIFSSATCWSHIALEYKLVSETLNSNLKNTILKVHSCYCRNIEAEFICRSTVFDWLTSFECFNLSKIELLIPDCNLGKISMNSKSGVIAMAMQPTSWIGCLKETTFVKQEWPKFLLEHPKKSPSHVHFLLALIFPGAKYRVHCKQSKTPTLT